MTPAQLVGARVRLARRAARMSQPELGRALAPYTGRAWHRQAVQAAEKGLRQFDAAELLALAAVLGRSVAWFFLPLSEPVELGSKTVTESELASLAGARTVTRQLRTDLMERVARQLASAGMEQERAERAVESLRRLVGEEKD